MKIGKRLIYFVLIICIVMGMIGRTAFASTTNFFRDILEEKPPEKWIVGKVSAVSFSHTSSVGSINVDGVTYDCQRELTYYMINEDCSWSAQKASLSEHMVRMKYAFYLETSADNKSQITHFAEDESFLTHSTHGDPLEKKSGNFQYNALYGDTTYPYSYDESWFLGSSTKYNHDLAKMSIRVAMATYMTGKNEGSNIGSGNISTLMHDELGFENLKVYYPNPTRDTIGYAIGSKPLGDTGKSLVLVAVRGGNYKAEWASNFTVADSLVDAGYYHAGFSSSAEKVQSALNAYLKNNGLSANDCVVWITSYSRGAAVSNFLAKLLDDGNIPGLGTDNVFAYCFACPQNSMASDLTAYKYNNIMNIVNPLDFVPMVAMSKWGYGRYGQTYYLPYEEGVGSRYNTLKSAMIKEYSQILAASKASDSAYQTTLQVPGQKDQTEGLMDWLAKEFHSPFNYYISLYQASLVSVVEAVFTKNWDAADYIALYPLAVKLVGIGLDTLVASMPQNILNDMLSDQTNMKALLAAELLVAGSIDRGNFKKTPISYTHYPELYLAWLDSLTGEQILSVNSKYRRVLVNCPVNISVYDSNDVLVGSIVDGVVQEIENGISVYVDEDGQFVLCMPHEEEFCVEMEATDDGTVTYTVTEQTLETSTPERVVSYPLMEVEKGDTFIGQVEAVTEEETAEYTLFFNEEKQESVELQGEEITAYDITCKVVGNGFVDGEGTAVFGEYKKLTATAGEDDAFLGWYDNNDILLSSEKEYRFCVQDHTTLVAKFTSSTKTGTCGDEIEGENLNWKLTKDGTLSIVGFGPMADFSTENPAPWSAYSSIITDVVISVGVTEIGENAFAECTNIQTVRSYAPEDQLCILNGNEPLLNALWHWITAWGDGNELALAADCGGIQTFITTDTACTAMAAVYDANGKFIACRMQSISTEKEQWTPDFDGLDLSECEVKIMLLTNNGEETTWTPLCNMVQYRISP